jgi:CheY-like chemotaxis protein
MPLCDAGWGENPISSRLPWGKVRFQLNPKNKAGFPNRRREVPPVGPESISSLALGTVDSREGLAVPPRPQHRILLVDDEPSILKIASMVLLRHGYRVTTAPDGDAGWKALATGPNETGSFDLLITDNCMPKLSGVELVEKLRSSPLWELPVIMASATPPPDTKRLHLAAILFKPFSSDRLLQTVEEVLADPMQEEDGARSRRLARRLLAYEAAAGNAAGASGWVAFRVCEKLRLPLVKLMGASAFRSLMTRAVAQSGADVPWLRALQITADGSLAGMDGLEVKLDPRAAAAGEAVLVAELLGLLETFVGSAFSQVFLRDTWPTVEWLDLYL